MDKTLHPLRVASGFFLSFFFLIIYLIFPPLVYLFLTALDLRCCAGFLQSQRAGLLSSCGAQGLTAAASLVAEHARRASGLQLHTAVSFPPACGIFPDQGLNLCPLH